MKRVRAKRMSVKNMMVHWVQRQPLLLTTKPPMRGLENQSLEHGRRRRDAKAYPITEPRNGRL